MAFSLWTTIKGLLIQDETDRTKELSLEIDPAATTDTRTTLKSAQTADRMLNLPDANDTLIGKDTTDILTNKTMDFSSGGTNVLTADATDVLFDNTTSGLTATNTQDAIDEVEGRVDTVEQALTDHLNDTVDAHDASAISNIPAGNLAATDVQSALNELQGDADTNATNISNHISNPTAAHAGSAVSNIPSGNLAANNVQSALNELQTDIDTRATATGLSNHISNPTGAHAASAISNTPSGNLVATDVQAALNELQTEVDGIVVAAGANQSLSNLTPTSINEDLIFDNTTNRSIGVSSFAGTGKNLSINSGAGTGTDQPGGGLNLSAGEGTGSQGSQDINFKMAPAGQASGATVRTVLTTATIQSLSSQNQIRLNPPLSGGVGVTLISTSSLVKLENSSTSSGSSAPSMNIQSGNNTGAGASGSITIQSANKSVAGNSGLASLKSGNAPSGNSANVLIASGTASGTRGDVVLDGTKIDASSTKIVNVTDPTSAQDAATKNYVDNAFSGVSSTNTILYTSGSGTYTKPSNLLYIKITAIGAGGGSGGAEQSGVGVSAGNGGGGGGGVIGIIPASSLSASESYSVGTSGTAGNNTGTNDGGTGGNTTFGTLITANGGIGGSGMASGVLFSGSSGAGGQPSNSVGLPNVAGGPGGFFRTGSYGKGGHGGGTILGGGTFTLARSSTSNGAIVGVNGKNYGCGGGAPTSVITVSGTQNASGAAGANGIIIIEEFLSS